MHCIFFLTLQDCTGTYLLTSSDHQLNQLISTELNLTDYQYICNAITFYSPSCLGQETAKGPFDLRVKVPPAHLSTTHGGGFTLSLALIAERQAGKL